MERIPADLKRAVVKAVDGSDRLLAESWAERPVVLAFVRHFG